MNGPEARAGGRESKDLVRVSKPVPVAFNGVQLESQNSLSKRRCLWMCSELLGAAVNQTLEHAQRLGDPQKSVAESFGERVER